MSWSSAPKRGCRSRAGRDDRDGQLVQQAGAQERLDDAAAVCVEEFHGHRPAPNTTNYVDRILAGLATDPNRIAFQLPDTGRLRCGRFSRLIHRRAHVFADHGIGPDSTVTLLSGDRADILAARYAANLLGA